MPYFAPKVIDGKIVISPPVEALEEVIFKWKPNLVGHFLDKPIPYFSEKKGIIDVEAIWSS